MLIKELTIEGFRGFSKFQLRDLGRVNLLVGTNNCGKTTILEAIYLLARKADWGTLAQLLTRRGEEFVDDEGLPSHSRKVDVRRLFHGHKLEMGAKFIIRASATPADSSLVGEFVQKSSVGHHGAVGLEWQGKAPNHVEIPLTPNRVEIPSTRTGGIPWELIQHASRPAHIWGTRDESEFVSALGADSVVEMFEEIVLTPDENLVYDALHIIEPAIDRIATTAKPAGSGLRGGILVHCSGSTERIPIGSFGEGIWRMLGLALALVRAKNGILLVDDIDTGLHHTVMEKMWQLVSETAKRLNTQVFATTHSRDCYESLATVCGDRDSHTADITIQRIERDRLTAVSYSEQAIVAAASRRLEVR